MPDTPSDREQLLARVSQVKRDATERLLAIPGVVAVGIGPKIVNGEATGEPAVRVFVRRKLPAGQVPPEQLIPAEIDGVTTDVAVGGDPILVATAPVDEPGAIGVLDARPAPTRSAHAKLPPDEGTARPLTGGRQIGSVENKGYFGTLGCLLWDPANHDIAYGLTNMHVVQPTVTVATKNVSKIGQPVGDDSSSGCCNDIIGVFAGGAGHTDDRDEALIRLSPGLKWQARIEGVGLIAGGHPLTPAEVTATLYKVAKRGRTTKLTGGTIAALEATTGIADNQIIIDPVANSGATGDEVTFFAIEGDSGSALVNSDNEVVGLVWGRNDAGQGLAFEIGHVLDRLKTVDGITVEVAKTTDPNEVHTVPGATLMAMPAEMAARVAADPEEARVFLGEGDRAPVARPWFADLPPSAPTVEQVLADLSASEAGRRLVELWQFHREEVSRLLQRDRRTALAWHRGGGAALTQLLLRLPAHPDRPLPLTLDGDPLMTVVDRMLALVSTRVSPVLGADLVRCRELMPDLAGQTYAGIVTALGEAELVSRV